MLGVLSRLVVAIAVVCGPSLAGRCSAQFRRPGMGVSQVAYWENSAPEPVAEDVPAGKMAPSNNSLGTTPAPRSELVGEFGDEFEGGASMFPGDDEIETEQESLIPDGLWNNRGPLWYSSLALTLIQRSPPSRQSTAIPLARVVVGTAFSPSAGVTEVSVSGAATSMTVRAANGRV